MSKALVSICGRYRYWLSRPCEVEYPEKSTAFFVMLNPSTADASIDDPTIRRCRGFAKLWQCNGIVVGNLYAMRATDPKDLYESKDPVGPDNEKWIQRLLHEHGDVVCAWGDNARKDQVEWFTHRVRQANARMWCLGITKKGAPRHPLYLKKDTPLIEWKLPL